MKSVNLPQKITKSSSAGCSLFFSFHCAYLRLDWGRFAAGDTVPSKISARKINNLHGTHSFTDQTSRFINFRNSEHWSSEQSHLGYFWWILMGSDGFWWILMGFDGLRWILMGSDGLRWILMDSDGFHDNPSLLNIPCDSIPVCYYNSKLLGVCSKVKLSWKAFRKAVRNGFLFGCCFKLWKAKCR